MLSCITALILYNCGYIKTVSGVHTAAVDGFKLIDFLRDVQRLHGFENILMVRNQNSTIANSFICGTINGTCNEYQLFRDIMDDLQVPVVLRNETDWFYLNQHFSKKMLAVVYIDGTWGQQDGLLRNLVLNMSQMTTSNILFLLNFNQVDKRFLNSLFRLCWSLKMINVVALFANYKVSKRFYSYTHFPEFMLETKTITINGLQTEPIFPYRLNNLKGYKLPYVLGGSEPRIIVYTKNNGELVVAGFVGHFIQAFAKKYNAQLVQPLATKKGEFKPAHELIQAVQNNSVDFSAALTFPTMPFIGFSYPYEILNSCIMLPVEPEVPHCEFYVRVFEMHVFALTILIIVLISMLLSRAQYQAGHKIYFLNIFVHVDCLRGVLGHSFAEMRKPTLIVRFIYLLICFLGILLTTSYNSYFSAFITSAPKQSHLRTLKDIQSSGLKVFVFAVEYIEYAERVEEVRKFSSIFHKEPDYKNYIRVRDSFNTEYAYIIPTSKWDIFNEQQKVFTKPIFRKSDDLCLLNNVPMCFPVHNNSIYKEPLEQLILETAQSGLTQYWRQNGFLELVAAGKSHFNDLSTKRRFKSMAAEDLQYIWIGMGFMGIVGMQVFIVELYIFNRRKIYNRVKSALCVESLPLQVNCNFVTELPNMQRQEEPGSHEAAKYEDN